MKLKKLHDIEEALEALWKHKENKQKDKKTLQAEMSSCISEQVFDDLKKEGYTVRFGEFTRIGLPFTLAAVIAAYLAVWFVWR